MGRKSIWHKKKKRKSILRPQKDKSPQAWQLIIHVYFHLQPRPDVSRNQGQAPVKAETFECSSSRNKASRLCQWRQDCRAAADCFTSRAATQNFNPLLDFNDLFSTNLSKKTLKVKWYCNIFWLYHNRECIHILWNLIKRNSYMVGLGGSIRCHGIFNSVQNLRSINSYITVRI